MKNIELRQLNDRIEALRDKMHRAGRPGEGNLQDSEVYKISRQLDRLILIAMRKR